MTGNNFTNIIKTNNRLLPQMVLVFCKPFVFFYFHLCPVSCVPNIASVPGLSIIRTRPLVVYNVWRWTSQSWLVTDTKPRNWIPTLPHLIIRSLTAIQIWYGGHHSPGLWQTQNRVIESQPSPTWLLDLWRLYRYETYIM